MGDTVGNSLKVSIHSSSPFHSSSCFHFPKKTHFLWQASPVRSEPKSVGSFGSSGHHEWNGNHRQSNQAWSNQIKHDHLPSQAIKSSMIISLDPIKWIQFKSTVHWFCRSRGGSRSSPGTPADLLWQHVHRHPPPWWINCNKNRQGGQQLGI